MTVAAVRARLRDTWQRSAPRREAWRWAQFPLGVFVVTRVALFGMSGLSLRLWPALFDHPSRRDALLRDWPTLDGLCRWDCGWYTKLAAHGYQDYLDAGFWPLFPALGKGVALLTGLPEQVALIVVANLAGLGALVVVYRLFVDLAGEQSARAALLLFAFYPFSFFHGAAYPESLMVLLTAGGLLLAGRGRYWAGGVVLGLGVLARHLSLLAAGGLGWLLLVDRRGDGRRRILTPSALALVLPPLAVGLFALVLYLALGDGLAFVRARDQGWHGMAWVSVLEIVHRPLPRFVANLIFSFIPGLGALLLLRDRRTWHLAAFAVPLMLFLWLVGLVALGRYSAACWPAFLPLGVWLGARPHWLAPVIGLLAVFWGLFAFFYVHQGGFF